MAPRIEEPQVTNNNTTPAATPPSSPLLPSRIVSVLVGNDQGGLLTVPPFSLGNTKDENTTTPLSSIKEKLSWTLHAATQQHRQLLDDIKSQQQQQQQQDGSSPPTTTRALVDACLFSLQGTAVMLIEHASRLVETMDATTPISMTMLSRSKSSSSSLSTTSTTTTTTTNMSMGRIRASLAVRWALQYLDSIRNAWEKHEQQASSNLNVKLQRLLDQMVVVSSNTRRPFRISPWILSPSQLAFDLIIGETATWSDPTTNIMTLSVDPMWQVKAEDLQSTNHDDEHDNNNNNNTQTRPSTITTCSLNILKVTHRGNGEALVKVGVAPLLASSTSTLSTTSDCGTTPHLKPATKKEKVVWGQVKDNDNKTLALRKKFRVQEARVVQLNADPPTPKVNVDLYESSMYGDSDTTVTLLVKTYPARSHETPDLHLELILAFE